MLTGYPIDTVQLEKTHVRWLNYDHSISLMTITTHLNILNQLHIVSDFVYIHAHMRLGHAMWSASDIVRKVNHLRISIYFLSNIKPP